MIHRLEIAIRPDQRDARGEHVAAQIRNYLDVPVERVRTRDVYHVEADLTADEAERIVHEFADPVLHEGAVGRVEDGPFDVAIAVAYKPGVADPIGKSARVAIEDTLQREVGREAAVYSSTLYLIEGADGLDAERIATGVLSNPLIQTADVVPWDEWRTSEPTLAIPKVLSEGRPEVQDIDLSGDDPELTRMSREGLLALSLEEMKAIRDQFRAAGEDSRRRELGLGDRPTDVELECLAQTWSEHCKHKIFNATIRYRENDGPVETIDSLFGRYIRGTTEAVVEALESAGERSWLVSVFHDNAGVVEFDDEVHLVYKVETHNSPSALDPYGGAITGIVGVNRDPFGTGRGANLIENVWGYCFASPFYDGPIPERLLHPRRIRDGVHHGVIDGGNQSGIPYGRGWEVFDDRYLGKPLVFCGTVGSLPVTIAGSPGEEKYARPGDVVVMVGGRIGADGIHGATFSSAALDESSPSQAVQIGDPITQRMMFDFLLEARDLGLYSAITDNGAGGLSSSVGEMAEGPGGARLDLALAPLKYAGLAPWEIFLSEAQERMTLAVRPEKLEALLHLAARRQVETTALGEFTSEPFLHVLYGDETVAYLPMEFLHDGLPEMVLDAHWQPPTFDSPPERTDDHGATLLDLLARPNLASGEAKARHYDHEVKGLAVVRPFIGVESDVPAEATVSLVRHGSTRGFVLSEGIHPFLSDLDTHAMAATVVDEAVRRQLCAGARLDRIAALDNFCWPDPIRSEQTPDGEYKLAQLVRACRGLAECCIAYAVPLISGKDSMKNESTLGGVKISVPPTLLLSAIGRIDDVRDAITLDWKSAGEVLYLIGETGSHLGAGEYYRYLGARSGEGAELGAPTPFVGDGPPTVNPERFLEYYRSFEAAAREGLIRSAATPTRGGLALALARSAMASGLGCEIDLDVCPTETDLETDTLLFSESNGRLIVGIDTEDVPTFEALFAGLTCTAVGRITQRSHLVLKHNSGIAVDLPVEELRRRFKEGLAHA